MLFFICMGGEIFAVAEPDLSDYSNHVSNSLWLIAKNSNDEYFLANTTYGSTLCANGITNNNGVYTCGGAFRSLLSGSNVWSREGTCVIYKFNTSTGLFSSYATNTPGNTTGIGTCTILYSGSNIANYNSANGSVGGTSFPATPYVYVPPAPYIEDDSDISTWSFDNLVINTSSVSPYWLYNQEGYSDRIRTFNLEIDYQGYTYTLSLNNYLVAYDNDYAIITIPKNVLSNSFNIYSGYDISFTLFVQPDDNPNSTGNWSTYSLGTYTLNLTTDEEEQINSDSTKQVIGAIDNGISTINNNLNNVNNNINNLNNNIDDVNDNLENINSTLTDTSNLPDFFTSYEDFAQNYDGSFGRLEQFEDIWEILYDAFYTDEVQNLVVQIPFTNNYLTIDEHLTDFIPQQFKNYVSMISWGVVVVYIMKDVYNMKDLFMSGNMEKVGKNVKKGDL